jgi:hypothetical protein
MMQGAVWVRTESQRVWQRLNLGHTGLATMALVLLCLVPSGSDAQNPSSDEAELYLAAGAFLRELGGASVVDEYRCDTRWLHTYGVPIRCRRSPFRTPLRAVAEDQGVPLVDQVVECGPEREERSLQLSPVQYESAEAAWFVVAVACAVAEDVTQQMFLVQVRRNDARWVLERTRLLENSHEFR